DRSRSISTNFDLSVFHTGGHRRGDRSDERSDDTSQRLRNHRQRDLSRLSIVDQRIVDGEHSSQLGNSLLHGTGARSRRIKLPRATINYPFLANRLNLQRNVNSRAQSQALSPGSKELANYIIGRILVIDPEGSDSSKGDRSGVQVVHTRPGAVTRSEEHTSELQSRFDLVCRLLLETKKAAIVVS